MYDCALFAAAEQYVLFQTPIEQYVDLLLRHFTNATNEQTLS